MAGEKWSPAPGPGTIAGYRQRTPAAGGAMGPKKHCPLRAGRTASMAGLPTASGRSSRRFSPCRRRLGHRRSDRTGPTGWAGSGTTADNGQQKLYDYIYECGDRRAAIATMMAESVNRGSADAVRAAVDNAAAAGCERGLQVPATAEMVEVERRRI